MQFHLFLSAAHSVFGLRSQKPKNKFLTAQSNLDHKQKNQRSKNLFSMCNVNVRLLVP